MNETEPTSPNEESRSIEESGPEGRPKVQPRIYVASLSDYNAGRLHGVWLDADVDAESLHEGIQTMLATSREPGAEEYAIHDYENFGPLRLSEYESVDSVSKIARGIAEHGMAFAHWADLVSSGNPEALERFEDAYMGHYDDLEDYGRSIVEDFGLGDELEEAVPDLVASYVHIDHAAFARDMEINGQITTSAGDSGIYIFEGTI